MKKTEKLEKTVFKVTCDPNTNSIKTKFQGSEALLAASFVSLFQDDSPESEFFRDSLTTAMSVVLDRRLKEKNITKRCSKPTKNG